MKCKWSLAWFMALLAAGLLSGCGGGGGGTASSGAGTLSLQLTDAATPEYQAVYVTIDEVQAHQAGGNWETVASPDKTYNLLDLANGVTKQLGVTDLPGGDYTQMRLLIGDTPDGSLNLLSEAHPFANYVVDATGQYHELKVPSGMQSGYKLVGGFTISAGQTTELLLDFDAARSVVKAGASGQWLLKPTVRVLAQETLAKVSGTVTDGETSQALEGATVSAQSENSAATDAKDAVTTAAATVSDSAGAYQLLVEPGTYNLVASLEGYEPSCTPLTVAAGDTQTSDFTLNPAAATGTVTGTVSITGGDAETAATLSFRQVIACGSSNVTAEVATLSIANGGTYSIDLPAGSYTLVVSAEGATTQSQDFQVTANAQTSLDLTL